MRIVFMGSPEEVIAPFTMLWEWCQKSENRHEIVGVVSQPPRPSGRRRQLQDPPLAHFAKEQQVPVFQPEKAHDPSFLDKLRSLKPDLIITAAYGQILTDSFLAIPSRATINIHPSLLPAFRGATPVQSALLAGLDETGVTILFTVKALDAGHLIIQQATKISPDERAGELMQRLFKMGGELLPAAIEKLADRGFSGTEQDASRVSHCSKISKEEACINWQQSSHDILNRFRAFYPWPGTYTFLEGKRIVIEKIHTLETPGLEVEFKLAPGELCYYKPWKRLLVGTGEGLLHLESVKPQGSKLQAGAAFWNGLKLDGKAIFQSTPPP